MALVDRLRNDVTENDGDAFDIDTNGNGTLTGSVVYPSAVRLRECDVRFESFFDKFITDCDLRASDGEFVISMLLTTVCDDAPLLGLKE